MKIYSLRYRWLAFILCLTLCLGNSSMLVLAVEENTFQTDDGYSIMSLEEAAAVSGNDEEADNQDASEEQTGSENTDSDQNQNAADLENDTSTETEDGQDKADTDKPQDAAGGGDSTDAVSDNDLDSVSDNTLESVSENDLDEERTALVKAAQEAFAKLAEEKMLMALLYHADTYEVRSKADSDSAVAATIEVGTTLYLRSVEITDDDVWYQVQFWLNGAEQTGYIQSYYLAYSDEDWIAWEKQYLTPLWQAENKFSRSAYGMTAYATMENAVDYSDIDAFPAAYQSALRTLKASHSNWTFVPMNTGLDFNTAVANEIGVKSLIQKTTTSTANGWVGAACPTESGWYYATEDAVAYYMNPCNFLTETYIFQFEQLTFNSSYHTVAAVQSFLNSTFMKGTLPDDSAGRSYAQAFYEIGKSRQLSPIHLASRVYQEQGAGTSGLISGTYPGYEGYYNFFNVNVSGSSDAEKIVKGLTYAKEKGWNTRYKSLDGGAATIGTNYILKGQDTIYLEKFNVNKDSPYGLYNHQYMQNIQAPASEASSTKKMYTNAGTLNSAFVFKIPVYNNMPGLKLDKESVTLNKGETSVLNASVNGTPLDASDVTWVSADESVAAVSVESGAATVTGISVGQTTITASYEGHEVICKITVKSPLQSISLQYDGETVTTEYPVVLRRADTVVTDAEELSGFSQTEIKENVSAATLQVLFDPEDTTDDRTIIWTTSNSKIATVQADPADSTKAVVTAKAVGEVTITAKASKAGNKTAKCKVRVTAPIYSLEVKNLNAKENDTDEQTTLYAGQSVNLTAEYYPKDTTSGTQVTWSSSDDKVVTVNNGKVTAVSAGTAEITARIQGCEGGEKVYSATHTIVVKECTVTFMRKDGTLLKSLIVAYGKTIAEEEFPKAEETDGGLFIGWYTGRNGSGSLFDETTAVYREQVTVYPYYEEQGKGFYVIPVGDQTYTGSVIKPVIRVYDSVQYEDGNSELIPLVLNQDYTVSYKNNKNVNAEGSKTVPTITVKGKGNYSGTQYVYFNIVPKALTDTDITVADITAAYTGKTIKSAPQVLRDGKKLKAKTDYTVSYPQTGTGAYQKAGTYPVVITGKGGYTGTVTIYEKITQDVLMSKVSITKIPNQTYSNEQVDKEAGLGIMPELTVKYKNSVLTESTDGGVSGDYTVTYQNNMAVGTATATITAVEGSGFAGSKSIAYKIVGISLAKAKVTGIDPKDYTGNEEDVKQTGYVLTLNNRELVENVDYTVSYSNLSKAGTAKITFQGINEYTGKITKSYKINAYNISLNEDGNNACISMAYYLQGEDKSQAKPIDSLEKITAPYVKGGSKPVVVLYFNGIELTPGKDYTIKYANNNAVTADDTAEKKLPKITITGKGNFKGNFSGTWRITDGQMSDDNGKLTVTVSDVVFKNKKGAYKASVTIKDVSGSKLAAGKDYEKNLIYTYEEETLVSGTDDSVIVRNPGDVVQADDIVPAGTTIRVTAVGKGAYAGGNADGASISQTYRIVAADISKATVKVTAKSYLNGREVTLQPQDLTVTFKGVSEPLVEGVDYVIDVNTYTNNTKKGKATVTIRGIGNYGREKKITYTIGTKQILWWKG